MSRMDNVFFNQELCGCGRKFAGYGKGMVISMKNKFLVGRFCATQKLEPLALPEKQS